MKNFKIYKFGKKKYANKDEDKRYEIFMERASLKTAFLESVANKFIKGGMTWIFEIARNETYNKNYMRWPHAIMRDILSDEYKIKFRIVWDQEYICVPLENKNMIEFFDKNIPEYVTIVKKI